MVRSLQNLLICHGTRTRFGDQTCLNARKRAILNSVDNLSEIQKDFRQNSMMNLKHLLLAFAFLLVTVTATPCAHSKNIITCCAAAKPTYKNGKVVKWSCLRCDDGFKVSSNKQQCIQDSQDQCGRGQGRDYFGNCAKCADKNCDTCSHLWTFCNKCKGGYTTDGDGQCVPLLL